MVLVFVLFLGVFLGKSMVTNKKKEKWYLRASVLKIKSHGLIKLHIYLIIESERQQTEIRQLFAYSFRKAMDFIN